LGEKDGPRTANFDRIWLSRMAGFQSKTILLRVDRADLPNNHYTLIVTEIKGKIVQS